MKDYLNENGMDVESLGKKDVAAMTQTAPEDLAEVLALRLQLTQPKRNLADNDAAQEKSRHLA